MKRYLFHFFGEILLGEIKNLQQPQNPFVLNTLEPEIRRDAFMSVAIYSDRKFSEIFVHPID